MRDPLKELQEDEEVEVSDSWDETQEHYSDRLQGEVRECYELMKAAILAGWDINSGRFAAFLMDRIWECLEATEWLPVKVYKWE